MKEFENLLKIADRLLGPGGCSWDREQTLDSLVPYLLEETHELMEAIDQRDKEKMPDELGDLFYNLIFIAKLGEKEGRFTLAESLQKIADKLIRRHPHIFANKKVESTDDIVKNWEAIKKEEGKKSPIDGIPTTLPSLSRAQKVIHKLGKMKNFLLEKQPEQADFGHRIWELVQEAERAGIDAESALRKVCLSYEEKIRNSK